jgi:hypothetical protein
MPACHPISFDLSPRKPWQTDVVDPHQADAIIAGAGGLRCAGRAHR